MEAKKGVGQMYRKGATKDCFLFDSWLSSNKFSGSEMYFGEDLILWLKQIQSILQGDHLEAYKGLYRSFLPHFEEQSYGTRGQAANFCWI